MALLALNSTSVLLHYSMGTEKEKCENKRKEVQEEQQCSSKAFVIHSMFSCVFWTGNGHIDQINYGVYKSQFTVRIY